MLLQAQVYYYLILALFTKSINRTTNGVAHFIVVVAQVLRCGIFVGLEKVIGICCIGCVCMCVWVLGFRSCRPVRRL